VLLGQVLRAMVETIERNASAQLTSQQQISELLTANPFNDANQGTRHMSDTPSANS
jgi:hypothetical protein